MLCDKDWPQSLHWEQEVLGTICLFIYKLQIMLYLCSWAGLWGSFGFFSNESEAVIVHSSAQHRISNFTATYFQNFFYDTVSSCNSWSKGLWQLTLDLGKHKSLPIITLKRAISNPFWNWLIYFCFRQHKFTVLLASWQKILKATKTAPSW